MADPGWYTITEAAEILGAKYDAVQKRANRYIRANPDSVLVRWTDPGADGGKQNVLLSGDLLAEWASSPSPAGESARERFLSEMLAKTADALREERDKRFADAEAKVADLEVRLAGREMELAEAKSQLRSVGSAFSQVVTDLTS